MSILAIDQGTTSTRALRLDKSGSAEVVKVLVHQQYYPHQGWVEHDPVELLNNVQLCINCCDGISVIGFDNQGESCLAWDADSGEAISPVIVWQDNRTRDVIDRLKAEGLSELVLDKAALPLDAYFSASKFGWIMRNIPEARRLADKGRLRLGTTDAFFLDRLTGNFVTDITTASRTSLLNLESGHWDPELCEIFGVPIDALPAVVNTSGDFGQIQTQSGPVPVRASIVDQQASLYGHGCRQKGDAKITFGTGAFALLLTGEQPLRAPEKGLLPTVAWKRDGENPEFALEGSVYCAGSAINWTRRLGLFEDYQQLNQFDQSPAIERGLAFVPALSGLACPYWDRSAAGLWLGMTLDTDKSDLLQSVLEGVAFRAAELFDAFGSLVSVGDAISVDGGVTANPYFCSFLAGALGRDIVVQEFAELTALGTALLASEGQIDFTPDKQSQRIYRADDSPLINPNSSLKKFKSAVARAGNWRD